MYVSSRQGYKPPVKSTGVSIISWLSVLYVLNGRKVTEWVLYRCEIGKI